MKLKSKKESWHIFLKVLLDIGDAILEEDHHKSTDLYHLTLLVLAKHMEIKKKNET